MAAIESLLGLERWAAVASGAVLHAGESIRYPREKCYETDKTAA